MNAIAKRLNRLEAAIPANDNISALIRVIVSPSENGPEETGAAFATFTDLPLPRLTKSLSETREEFEARVDDFSNRISRVNALPEDENKAEREKLADEVEAANQASGERQ